MSKTYKELQLNEYFSGLPSEKTWNIATSTLRDVKDGEVLIKVEWWSVDPYMRTRMAKGEGLGFGRYPLKTTIPTAAVGKIVQTKNENHKVGDFVYGFLSLSEYAYFTETKTSKLIKCDPKVPLSYYLSAFGLTGGTAYQGAILVANVQKGHNFYVNAAAGAVGSIAGVIAKLKGARVIGSAGGADKCKLLVEKFGFDGAIDHNEHKDKASFLKALKEKFPNGIDRYFDNVGGFQTDAVMEILNRKSIIAVCGQISQYNKEVPDNCGFNLGSLIYRSIRIEGFVFGELVANQEEFQQFVKDMTAWVSTGKIPVIETVYDGFDKIPQAFVDLLTGKNVKGKVVIKSK